METLVADLLQLINRRYLRGDIISTERLRRTCTRFRRVLASPYERIPAWLIDELAPWEKEARQYDLWLPCLRQLHLLGWPPRQPTSVQVYPKKGMRMTWWEAQRATQVSMRFVRGQRRFADWHMCYGHKGRPAQCDHVGTRKWCRSWDLLTLVGQIIGIAPPPPVDEDKEHPGKTVQVRVMMRDSISVGTSAFSLVD